MYMIIDIYYRYMHYYSIYGIFIVYIYILNITVNVAIFTLFIYVCL